MTATPITHALTAPIKIAALNAALDGRSLAERAVISSGLNAGLASYVPTDVYLERLASSVALAEQGAL